MSLLQLNAFDTNINDDCTILCQGSFHNKMYPNILEHLYHHLREPFKKRITISMQTMVISKVIPPPYDTSFVYREMADWSLILSYINYVQKPVLILAEDIQIPEQVLSKLKSIKGVITIHVMTVTPVNIIRPYDCVFFSPIDNITSVYAQSVLKYLQSQYRSTITSIEFKEIVQELSIEKAGLMWSNYKEQRSSGSLYWYEPASMLSSDYFSKKQLSEIFNILSIQFNH